MDVNTPAVDSMSLIAAMFTLLPIPVAVADEKGCILLSNSCFAEAFPAFTCMADMPRHGTFEFQTLPLNDRGYQFIYATDVSVQIHLGQQVEQLEKLAAVGRVVAGIGHELHNPLADIMEYVPMIAQCSMDSTARSIVDVVFTSAERAGHLIQNLLILAGATETRLVPLDLNEIVRNVAIQRGASHSGPPFEIRLELQKNLPRTVGLPSQIEQVITALFIHAEDAIAGAPNRHGSIQVQTGVRAGRIQLQVADNGQARDTARIFAPDSSGVGLNACAEIAKDHGGELYSWSAYSHGSIFTLELPAYRSDEDQDGAGIASSAATSRALRDRSVIVVDDEVHITQFIADVLTRYGAKVQVSNSGSDAYERLFETEYDLIICNPLMPGFSGESLCRLMKSANPSRNQRFLFMTGEVISVHARQFFAQSGVQYLRKPFRIQELVDAVEGIFSRSLLPDC